MTRVLISRMATVAGVLALASACTMTDQEAPPLTGPSEFGQSIITVSPDVLPQDGASQSFITVTALDANSQPMRNLTLRAETRVGGTPVDFGTLSARSVVTGNDGKATLVYTAPPSPAVSPDAFLLVDIVVTPLGTDYNNSTCAERGDPAGAAGAGHPAGQPGADFTFTPAAPTDGQTVLFDASRQPRDRSRRRVELRRRRPRRRPHRRSRLCDARHVCRHADGRPTPTAGPRRSRSRLP